MMTSSIRLSSNRSSVRTNQNACITELIILQKLDQYQYLGNCPPTPNNNLLITSWGKCWVMGGVGGQLTKY